MSWKAFLPGRGTLAFKLASYNNKLVIPADKREAVFEAALAACRERTLTYWDLPTDESLSIEWTRDVQAAWHQYEGANKSTLRINGLTVGPCQWCRRSCLSRRLSRASRPSLC